MSAASSSGASDQPPRAISSFSGAFGYSSSRYSDAWSGASGDQRVDVGQPRVDALPGQPHHQVEADVVEAGRPRLANRRARASRQWSRPSRFSSSSRKDWTPKLRRLTPAARKRSSSPRSTVSGLVSSVTRVSGSEIERVAEASTIDAMSSGSSSDGVPPPKKIVSARRSPDLRAARGSPAQRRDVALLQRRVEEPRLKLQ